jgi:hypothetical protein
MVARVINMNNIILSSLKRKLRTSLYLIIFTAIRFKEKENLRLNNLIQSPSLKISIALKEEGEKLTDREKEKQQSPLATGHSRRNSNRGIAILEKQEKPELQSHRTYISTSNPSQNKNIESTKIIKAARWFIGAQEKYNNMRSRALHLLIKHKNDLQAKESLKDSACKKLVSRHSPATSALQETQQVQPNGAPQVQSTVPSAAQRKDREADAAQQVQSLARESQGLVRTARQQRSAPRVPQTRRNLSDA